MAVKCVLTLVILSLGCLAAATATSRSEDDTAALFDSWLSSNPRAYKDAGEKQLRYQIFKHNVKIIDSHNEKESSYKLGLNQFADLTSLEFQKTHLGRIRRSLPRNKATPFRYANVTPPASIDWRKKGAVTPIKDQGQCGSCWTFSTIGAVEGIVEIKTKDLISLSEQELVSCDTSDGNAGCEGGDMYTAMEWIVKNGGVNSEAAYPYTGQDDPCNTKKRRAHVATIDGYENVPANSETDLQKAVANQPVAISLDGGDSSFQFYSSCPSRSFGSYFLSPVPGLWLPYLQGILSGSCGTDLDHGVVAVGYGTTTAGEDFWIVKNSWGTTWGEQGYIRLKRNIDAPEGMCGLAMDNSYPTKD